MPGSSNTLGSLTWDGGGTLKTGIGSGSTSTNITGALTKGATGGSFTIDLYINSNGTTGVVPGVPYNLLYFGSNAGFLVSDFIVNSPYANGQLALTAGALTYTVPIAPPPILTRYDVAMSVAKGKSRATFTITNTGNTTTGFQLFKSQQTTNSYAGPKPSKPPKKSPIVITYSLNGSNITQALDTGTAAIAIPAGGSVSVVVKVKTRNQLAFKRTIKALLTAISQADASKTASATATIVLKPDKK